MITLTFNGAVNIDNILIYRYQPIRTHYFWHFFIVSTYRKLFHQERLNPNSCTAKATFFVSHKYTNYSAVQELHRQGHEIGVFSITNNEDHEYWSQGSYEDWLGEMAGDRLIIEVTSDWLTHEILTSDWLILDILVFKFLALDLWLVIGYDLIQCL